MGQYINKVNGKKLPIKGKTQFMLNNIDECVQIATPAEFKEDLVCIVDNGMFEAAAYCYSANEMREFRRDDGRRKQWLIVPNASTYVG